MEFYEKLQELRKSMGLTQEELADALHVSRTAVSKWESNRGYPSIDSLKEISAYFSVTIDELLSGEKIISIAEREHKGNIRSMCNLLFGITDMFFFMVIALPLYPQAMGDFVYSVSLFDYTGATFLIWGMLLVIILNGAAKVMLTQIGREKGQRFLTGCSVTVNIAAVIYLALARVPYALIVAFLLLVVKGALLLKID